ncbi:MAG: hypothetical protein IT321_12820 [Anaerolineae bacterium]|nr:hypothetical protein [Anaerolineae bacterium]
MHNTFAEAQAQFITGDYDAALASFQHLSSREPLETMPLAGMALCYYALGKAPHARRMWKIIVSRDERYLLPRFLRKELGWPDAMLETARKVNELVV